MKKSRRNIQSIRPNDKSLAARDAPIPDMVTELLAKVDPEKYIRLLEALRAHYHPADVRGHLIEYMAGISWRIGGCAALETEILTQGMEASANSTDDPDLRLARAYMDDFKGPDLLSKLSRYQDRLSRQFSRCLRLLELRAKNRKKMEAIMSANLNKLKPCTSVVQ